jgi:hypothetical protein
MVEFHMVPAESRLAVDIHRAAARILVAGNHRAAAHILAADCHRVAAHILIADCYRDPFAEVALGEYTHHTDLADLGLGLD